MPSKYDTIREASVESCKICEEAKVKISDLQAQVRKLTADKSALQGRVNSLTVKHSPRIIDLKKPFYRIQPSLTTGCPICMTPLYIPGTEEGTIRRRSSKDEVACAGKKWWNPWALCIDTAHLHRYCSWCHAKWVEYP